MLLRKMRFYLILLTCAATGFALDRVVGANETLSMGASARASGTGESVLALPSDALTVTRNPLGALQFQDPWVGIGHASHFENTNFDALGLAFPLDSASALGVLLSRSGAGDIPWIREGEAVPQSMPTRTLSISDWALGLSWAKSMFDHRLHAGVTVHGIWRELDQTGFGFRSDLALRWYMQPSFFVHTQVEGWLGSLARWESGTVEYTAPELRVALGYQSHIDYLYGQLNIGWQGAGLIHHRNQDLVWDDESEIDSLATDLQSGDRVWEDPLSWLQAGSLGAELQWDWGGSVRLGLLALDEFSSWTAGMGILFKDRIQLDYAFENHPIYNGVHRVSITARLWQNPKSIPPKTPKISDPIEPKESTTLVNEPEPIDDSSGKTWEE